MLGSAPEKFAAQPHVSNALDGRFFIHEVSEELVKVPKSRKLRVDDDSSASMDTSGLSALVDDADGVGGGDGASLQGGNSIWSKAKSLLSPGASPASPLGPSYVNRRQVTLRFVLIPFNRYIMIDDLHQNTYCMCM
jgi:hypothetical protein